MSLPLRRLTVGSDLLAQDLIYSSLRLHLWRLAGSLMSSSASDLVAAALPEPLPGEERDAKHVEAVDGMVTLLEQYFFTRFAYLKQHPHNQRRNVLEYKTGEDLVEKDLDEWIDFLEAMIHHALKKTLYLATTITQ